MFERFLVVLLMRVRVNSKEFSYCVQAKIRRIDTFDSFFIL